MSMYEGEGSEELTEEIADTLVIEGCNIIREMSLNFDHGERTELMIDVAEIMLHKLLTVYPTLQPLTDPYDLIDRLIASLEDRKDLLDKPRFFPVVN